MKSATKRSVEFTDEEIIHLLAMLRVAGFKEKLDAAGEVDELRAVVAERTTMLTKYGAHTAKCPAAETDSPAACSCGWAAIKKGIEEEAAQDAADAAADAEAAKAAGAARPQGNNADDAPDDDDAPEGDEPDDDDDNPLEAQP